MFKTYKASAGSGKTTNLVAEYLSICLPDPTMYEHILAITFTNAATAEMKERILQTLNDFAFIQPIILLDEKNKSFSRSRCIYHIIRKINPDLTDESIQNNSLRLLEKILTDYPKFTVTTIDSFFQRIVRSFAFELGFNMNFEVEITLDDYFAQTIDLLFNKLVKNTNTQRDLVERVIEMVDAQLKDKGTWKIDGSLLDNLEALFNDERATNHLSQLADINFAAAKKLLVQNLYQSKKILHENIEKGKQLINNCGLTDQDFTQGSRSIYTWFDKIKENEYSTNAQTEKVLLGTSPLLKENKYLLHTTEDELLQQYQIVQQNRKEYLKIKILLQSLWSFQLLNDLKAIMSDLRDKDNKFFLSETGHIINDNIKNNPAPYIYSKVGNKFVHYFIDEFQDTSNTQWNNLLPLLDDAMSQGGLSILFGDVKQAIYRFRNGNPQLFAELTNEQQPRNQMLSKRYGFLPQNLDVNYRTGGNIINFNNYFFSKLPTYPSFPSYLQEYRSTKDFYNEFYHDVVQKIPENKKGKGYVCVEFQPTQETKDNYLRDRILWAVQDALARGFQKKDIAILVRKNDIGTLAAQVLTENQIPIISSATLLLRSSDDVNLVINCLRYIVNPWNTLAKLTIVKLLLKRDQKEENLSNFMGIIQNMDSQNQKIPQNATQKEKQQIKNENESREQQSLTNNTILFQKLLKDEFALDFSLYELSGMPLYPLIIKILQVFHLEKMDDYIVDFLDCVAHFIAKNAKDIASFLTWWEANEDKLSITSPEGIDAVKISTIHAAKGKEYPVVIMPCLNVYLQNTEKTVWMQLDEHQYGLPVIRLSKNKQMDQSFETHFLAEEQALSVMDVINILYVAHTRPIDAFYIITGSKYEEKTSKNSKSKKSTSVKGDAKYVNYNLFLEDFISDTGENHPKFQQDDSNPYRFFYGNVPPFTTITPQLPSTDTSQVEHIYTSDFTFNQLIISHESNRQHIGTVVHDFLAKLEYFPHSIQEINQMTIAEDIEYKDEIRAALRYLIKQPYFMRYFADNLTVLKEVSILTTEGEIRRPDRVILLDNETVILDYKTGTPTEAVKEKYQKQLQNYTELLTQMGYPNVHGELIFLPIQPDSAIDAN